MIFYRIVSIFLLISLFFLGCQNKEKSRPNILNSRELKILPLKGKISGKKTEISGLTWYKEQLIILPQYPDRFSKNSAGALFTIPKEDILAYIDGKSLEEFNPERIEFHDQRIRSAIDGFQGYEAILFNSNKVYLAIEALHKGVMSAYLIEGAITGQPYRIDLNLSSLRSLPMPVNLRNFAYESMIHSGEILFSFYEANGINANPNAYAPGYNLQTGDSLITRFPNIEYRVTDATQLDSKKNFWIINYFWPGDYDRLSPGIDSLAFRSDFKAAFSADIPIERLVEMHYTGNRFVLTQTDPINLAPESNGESRNWEGIVKLDDRGFIIATDKHPRTILAFVPREIK